MSKTKICILCERWESGGIESFITNVLTHIDLTNSEIDIVACSLSSSVFQQTLENIGITFVELSGRQNNVFANCAAFKTLCHSRRYDIIYLHAYQALSMYYLKVAESLNIQKRIVHSHNTALRKSKTKYIKGAVHLISKKLFTKYATDLLACSELAASFMFDKKILTKKGYSFIPNGIETKRFKFEPISRQDTRRQLDLEGKFVIGNIGRLCYQKNQDFLIDIFYEIQKKRPNSVLLLVGEGPDESALRNKVKGLEIDDKVCFYGTSKNVEKLLWAMDVFVFPSYFEGLGIVAIEAQAAGLPIICSENIPKEAFVTPIITAFPLSKSTTEWAAHILLTEQAKDRRIFNMEVAAKGFSVTAVSCKIAKYLKGY